MLIFLLPYILLFRHIHGAIDPRSSQPSSSFNNRVANSSLPDAPFANSTSELETARLIVKEAQKEWSVWKKARYANPRRNVYSLRPEEPVEAKMLATDNSTSIPPAGPEITEKIARAAALLAEHKAALAQNNATRVNRTRVEAQDNRFWMENIDHLGTQPYGGNTSYPVCGSRCEHLARN
jgi:hypothetical protein